MVSTVPVSQQATRLSSGRRIFHHWSFMPLISELVSFLHLPVQSGSDRILTMMKRPHTAIEYKSIIRKLRKARPDIQISSDFIVGFSQVSLSKTSKIRWNWSKKLISIWASSFVFSPSSRNAGCKINAAWCQHKRRKIVYTVLQQTVNTQAKDSLA